MDFEKFENEKRSKIARKGQGSMPIWHISLWERIRGNELKR